MGKKDNWISVEDRLPNYVFTVIVQDIDENVCEAHLLSKDDNDIQIEEDTWFDSDGIPMLNSSIVYWQPFPRARKIK